MADKKDVKKDVEIRLKVYLNHCLMGRIDLFAVKCTLQKIRLNIGTPFAVYSIVNDHNNQNYHNDPNNIIAHRRLI